MRCACKSGRGWVVQASAVSAMRLGVGVVSPVAINGRPGMVSFLLKITPEAGRFVAWWFCPTDKAGLHPVFPLRVS